MYKFYSRNDIGAYEKVNDDKFMINGKIVEDGDFSGEVQNYVSAVLCDGVGGEAQGYRAALKTLEVFKEIQSENVDKEKIKDTARKANSEVLKLQREENREKGLKTTLAGIYANKEVFIYYNIGDSRVYRYRNGYLQRLTRDDSKVQEFIDDGVLTPEQVFESPLKNIITRCIGGKNEFGININSSKVGLMDGDVILLCSDGVTDVIDDNSLKAIFDKKKTVEETLEEIHSTSLKNKSMDNISLILIKKEKDTNEW